MGMELTPYTGSVERYELAEDARELLGIAQCLYITLENPDDLEKFVASMDAWFEDREDVTFIAKGVTYSGIAFCLYEWDEVEIDRLLIDQLTKDPYLRNIVDDFAVYPRSLGLEQ